MRGRNKFDKIEKILIILTKFLTVLPKSFSRWLYNFIFHRNGLLYVGLRYSIIKRLCPSIGENIYIARNVVIKNFERLKIGNNVSIHEFCYIDAEGEVEIENDVSIAHGCSIISSNHDISLNEISIKDKKNVVKKSNY